MTTQEERERALAFAINTVLSQCAEGDRGEPCNECHNAAVSLRSCVPIERAEYDRLRRALWEVMRHVNGGSRKGLFPGSTGKGKRPKLLAELGMMELNEYETGYVWTPAAHEFARAMEKKGGEGA